MSLVDLHKRDWSWQSTALTWAVPHWDWKSNNLVNKQSHSGRFTHELAVLWVVLWKEICCCPKFALSFCRMFLLAMWLYLNAFSPDLPLSSLHRIWWQFLIFMSFDRFTAGETPRGEKVSFPTSWFLVLTSRWFIEKAACTAGIVLLPAVGFLNNMLKHSYSLFSQANNLTSQSIMKP